MKIGFICHDAFPIAQPFQGGLEMITFILVEELVSRGHEVVSLCLEGSQLSGEMVYYSKVERINNVLDDELKSLCSVSYALNKFLQMEFDVIQNHSLHYQSILLGNVTAQNFITTFHTPVFPYLDLAIKAISANIHQSFVGVSDSISSLYEEILPSVATIHNGINLSLWQYEYDIVDDYYSWCGRICKEKGLAELMELCLKENIKLKIAGPISNVQYYESKIKPLLKFENFEYVGHLKHPELNVMIRHSKSYIFSSVWEEPYGLVIAEALACGVPVLANNVGAASEIIDGTSGCLFYLKNSETFKIGLNTVKNLSRKDCRNRAESFCSHTIMVDKYESLYTKVSGVYLEKVV